MLIWRSPLPVNARKLINEKQRFICFLLSLLTYFILMFFFFLKFGFQFVLVFSSGKFVPSKPILLMATNIILLFKKIA